MQSRISIVFIGENINETFAQKMEIVKRTAHMWCVV